jgi:hypothetical protein
MPVSLASRLEALALEVDTDDLPVWGSGKPFAAELRAIASALEEQAEEMRRNAAEHNNGGILKVTTELWLLMAAALSEDTHNG